MRGADITNPGSPLKSEASKTHLRLFRLGDLHPEEEPHNIGL